MPSELKQRISAKISKIMHEGIRKNTQKPVSSKNQRQKVDIKRAIAIAHSMVKKGKK